MRGMSGCSMFARAAGLQQGRSEHSRVFLEAGGLGIATTSLQLGAGDSSVGLQLGCEGGLRLGKDGARLIHLGGGRTERPCALCLVRWSWMVKRCPLPTTRLIARQQRL